MKWKARPRICEVTMKVTTDVEEARLETWMRDVDSAWSKETLAFALKVFSDRKSL